MSSQSYGFSSSPVWMWDLEHKEDWALKNWCFWTVVLEKTLESPLDCKEIKPINPKEINPEYSSDWLMLKLKLQYFDHLIRRTNSLEKPLMLGKIEDRRKRGWQRMRWLDGQQFEEVLGDNEGQGSLAFCSPWDHKESDMTERLSWTELMSCKVEFDHTLPPSPYILVQDKFILLLFSCNNFWSSLSAFIFPNFLPPYYSHSSWNHPF